MQGVHRDLVVGDGHGDVEDGLGTGLREERREVPADRDRRGAGQVGPGACGVEVEVDDADELDVGVGGDGGEPRAAHPAGTDLHDPQRGVLGHARTPAAWSSACSDAGSTGSSSNGPR